jgi:hypothetical protein
MEDKRNFAVALNMHPAMIDCLDGMIPTFDEDQQHQEGEEQCTTENLPQSKNSLNQNKQMSSVQQRNNRIERSQQDKIELQNQILFRWLKRQNIFQMRHTMNSITSALIDIGRVDLAYLFHIQYLANKL